MDRNAFRRLSLIRAYRGGQLGLDGLISCASLMGLDSEEMISLLDDAAECEPGSTSVAKRTSMLVRSFRLGRLTYEQVVSLAIDLGFESFEIAALIELLFSGSEGMAA